MIRPKKCGLCRYGESGCDWCLYDPDGDLNFEPKPDAIDNMVAENERLKAENAALCAQLQQPENKPLKLIFGHGELAVNTVAENEDAPLREILIRKLESPMLPIGSNTHDKGKSIEDLDNVLLRMHFDNADSVQVLKLAADVVLDSFGLQENKPLALDGLSEISPYKDMTRAQFIEMCVDMGFSVSSCVSDNLPLTFEELREMDGEPIWTETIGIEGLGRWELCTCETVRVRPLHQVFKCVTAYGEATDYEFDTYGKTWRAYDRKPTVAVEKG